MHFSPPSLRVRLMVLVSLALLPIVALFVVGATYQRQIAFEAIDAEALRLARLCADNQQRVLESSRQMLVTLAQLPPVLELDGEKCRPLFARIRQEYPLCANIGLLDRDGDLISSALPASETENFSHRPYFQRALQTRTFAVGDFQVGEITGKSTVNVAVPILDRENNPIAVLFAALELAWLEEVASVALPPSSLVVVLDQNGTILARVPEAEKWVGKSASETAVKRKILEERVREGTVFGPGADGVERIFAFTHIDFKPLASNQAYVIVGLSRDEAFRSAREALTRHLTLLGFIGALALTGAWHASSVLIVRPVRSMVVATRRLAAGDLTTRTGLKPGDELGELGRAFDEMAATIEGRSAERDRAELALRQSEETFRNLFEGSPDAIFVEALDGTVLDVNPAACRLHGLPRSELIGKSVVELVPASIRTEVRDSFQNWNGKVTAIESRSLTADGSEIPVDIRSSRIQFKGSEALLFHVRDISRTKQIEDDLQRAREELERRVAERTAELAAANAALLESTERFELVLMGTNDGIWDWDLRNNEVYFSRRWKAMLGYEYDELDNDLEEWRKRLHPDEADRVFKTIEDYVNGRTQTYEIEHRLQAKDGTWRWILARGYALRDETGRAYRIAGSHMDLTERIKAQEALRMLAENLRRSNEDLEQFAYVASHDLQEPLRMVASYTQLLERRYKGQLDPAASEFINYAVDGAHRMQQVINDLLEYSRLATQGKPFGFVDLEVIVEQVLKTLELNIHEHRARITRDPLPTIRGDAGQLVRLFQNLISNAIKFHHRKTPEIHLGARRTGEWWEISVRDQGIGIAPQFFERIFLIFQRLHTREEYPGTGIGLAVCKKIVERHGGEIWVESELGRGTTFFFTFPADESIVPETGIHHPPSAL